MNTYSSLVLRSMGGNRNRRPRPQWVALKMALATTRLRLTRTTLAFRTTVPAIRVSPLRGGSGGFASARGGFGGSARGGFGGFGGSRDSRPSSPSLAAHGAACGAFGSRSRNGAPSPSPAASGGAARGSDARAHSDHDDGRQWKQMDFPTEEALRKCKVKRHEDLPRHIYLLLDILGLQFRWLLTRMGK